MTAGCWADPLTPAQRHLTAKKLARARRSFRAAALVPGKSRTSLTRYTTASDEMDDLRADITRQPEATS